MKKSLLIAGLLLAGTTGAWAQVFTDIHEPYRWLFRSVESAVSILHGTHHQFRSVQEDLYANVFNKNEIVDMSAAELCDEYEAACRVHKIIGEPCTKFIATVVDEHDKSLGYYTSLPQDQLSWDAPDKVANIRCLTFSHLCGQAYDTRDGELFKACTNLTDAISEQKCKGSVFTVRMSPRGFYNICTRTKFYPETSWEDNKYNKQDACYDLTDALIDVVNYDAKRAKDGVDRYRNTLQPSKFYSVGSDVSDDLP